MNEKNTARKMLKSLLKNMTDEERAEHSKKACEIFLGSNLFLNAQNILLYSASHLELDTSYIFEAALKKGAHVYFPSVNSDGTMDFYEALCKDDLSLKNSWGIAEPKKDLNKKFDIKKTSGSVLVVVPGVGFLKNACRLGHGKGFYDLYLSQLLKNKMPKTDLTFLGICFECQTTVDFKTDSHDILMDALVTEKDIYFFKSRE